MCDGKRFVKLFIQICSKSIQSYIRFYVLPVLQLAQLALAVVRWVPIQLLLLAQMVTKPPRMPSKMFSFNNYQLNHETVIEKQQSNASLPLVNPLIHYKNSSKSYLKDEVFSLSDV